MDQAALRDGAGLPLGLPNKFYRQATRDDIYERCNLKQSGEYGEYYLGEYDNIVEGATAIDSDGKDGRKTVVDVIMTYQSFIDNKYDTGYVFGSNQNEITLVITFKSPLDGEDSYGINKLFIFSDLNIESSNGWRVYVKSIPRNGAEWPCHKDPITGDAVPTVGKRNDKFEGWEAEVICGPNTQAKNLVLKHSNAVSLKLTEIRVAGLQSSKYSCDLGWKPGTQTCSRCPPGQKGQLPTSEEGQPQCVDCPAGWFSAYLDDFEPILECTECTAGKYSQAGSASCTECEPGTYQDLAGQSSCKVCAAGTFQELRGKTGYELCEEGFFSNAGSSECEACAVGTVAATKGSAECTKCSPGHYQKDRGQSICLGCQAGFFSKVEGADSCTACPKGEYNNEVEQSGCLQCQAGQYQPSTGQTKCIECNVGTFNDQPGQDSCQQCAVGMYLELPGQTSCKECVAGTYQDVMGSIACKPCPPLTYQNQNGASKCDACGEGEISEEGATVCTPCTAGTYLDSTTKTCKICPAGTSSADRASSCTPCDVMFYQPDKGQSSCLACEAGTITEEKGSVSCTKCERGTYRSAAMTAPKCEACPAGFFSGQQGLAACTPCATGTYSQGQAIECDKCGKGTFQKKEGQETCEECPPGYFSDTEGLTECTPCKVDTVASESGSTSCVVCSYGFYSPQKAGTVCKTCPKRAAYQPPSCPPIIPNCPALELRNQYGNFSFPEMEPPDDGSGIPHEQDCEFALFVDDEKVFGKIVSECRTWFENGDQKSNWTTPSYAKCGTIQTEIIYNETKAARDAIKDAGNLEEATVEPAMAESMLTNLMGVIGTSPSKPDDNNNSGGSGSGSSGDGENGGSGGGDTDQSDPDKGDDKTSEESEKKESSLGAADTANVVKTLAVVTNSVPPAVLADPDNQKNILGAISSFAEQDDDFVQDAGTDTASAAVNVVESIGASMFAVAAPEPDPGSGNGTDTGDSTDTGEGEKKQEKKKNEIKTDTMTIVPTPITEETLTAAVVLDFGDDEEEEEDETTEKEDSTKEEADQKEEAVEALPATEAPIIPDPVQADEEEPAPTAPPVLQVVRATKPPPVKKIVKVEMPPLNNLVKASESGGEKSDAQGLVCVVFETPALFPTNKTAQKAAAAAGKKNSESVPEPKVASKVVLLSFGSKSIQNIDPPLALNFTKDEPEDYDPSTQDVQYKCVYYDKEKKTWETDGCETTSVDKTRGGQVSCSCNHMTSFAILMSLEPIPDYLSVIQSQITNPLLGCSLFFLLFMIATIVPFKALRSTRSMKIHLSLAGSQCFAIVIFLLTNLKGVISEDVPALCKTIAILMDYSYLVVFMWTVVESVIMYISLVQVFGGHISRYMLKFNLFCWITPLLSPLTAYFLTEGILLQDGKCVIDLEIRKWSFILPIGVILCINFFIFLTLLKVIANTKNPDKSTTENTLKQLKAVASISCMLGLGWILGFFMHGSVAPYFQFVFIIINGLQGVLMFLFYCVGNEQYMDLWKTKFGIEVKKGSSSSSAAGRPSTVSNIRVSTVQGPSVVVANPMPASSPVTAAKPAPVSSGRSLSVGAPSRGNRRVSRAQTQAIIEEEGKKLDDSDNTSVNSAIYENENVYDIIDDPDIQAKSPATITRI